MGIASGLYFLLIGFAVAFTISAFIFAISLAFNVGQFGLGMVISFQISSGIALVYVYLNIDKVFNSAKRFIESRYD